MKKTKEIIAVSLIFFIVLSLFSTMFNKTYAAESEGKYVVTVSGAKPARYNFNPGDVLRWAAKVGTMDSNPDAENPLFPLVATEVTKEALESGKLVYLKNAALNNGINGAGHDNAKEATALLRLRSGSKDDVGFGIKSTLAEKFNISEDSIVCRAYLNLGENNEKLLTEFNSISDDDWKKIDMNFLNKVFEYQRSCATSDKYKSIDTSYQHPRTTAQFDRLYEYFYNGGTTDDDDSMASDSTITAPSDAEKDALIYLCDNFNNLEENEQNELRDRYAKYIMCNGNCEYTDRNGRRHNTVDKHDIYDCMMVEAELPDGSVYNLVVGKGTVDGVNYDYQWLLERSKEGRKEEKEWETEMEYISVSNGEIVPGKMSTDGTTYLPPYYDNDNSKKDADVTVTIKSKTTETIVATNNVALTSSNTKKNPNSEGWYYPDPDKKTIIAKDYPFDAYDNTTYNGKVKETVALTGGNGGKSSQTPSIEWTFRRTNLDKKEYTDGSTTVVITYNLPIDTTKVPDGWTPIYDADGKTAHKITKTFKVGEGYDKDVVVKQNGTDATVTTHVTVKAAPTTIVKAGQSMAIVGVILAVVVMALNRYFRFNKMKKIK